MNSFLKKRGFKTLVTLNEFVRKVASLEDIKEYQEMLDEPIAIESVVPYDIDGVRILNHNPLFKGWGIDKKLSDKKMKVAKRGKTLIYFHFKESPLIYGEVNVSDKATYNDLAIFFYDKLVLN